MLRYLLSQTRGRYISGIFDIPPAAGIGRSESFFPGGIEPPLEPECGNFAQELHNNAEEAGIRTAFVAIHYEEGIPHAINAFKTIDQGLVYIDVTGSPTPLALANLDKKITISEDLVYTSTLLFPEWGWSIPQDYQIVVSMEIYW